MPIRTLIYLLLLLLVATEAAAAQRTVRVRGYYRSDGTYVAPHYRTAPNSTRSDNWSTKGNVNPYTGEPGTRPLYDPPAYDSRPVTPVTPVADTILGANEWYAGARPFYLHGRMNIRSGPGTSYPVVRTLERGTPLLIGTADARGWAPVLTAGGGYIYRASSLVRSRPPSTAAARPRRQAHPAGASAICRDGTYSYSRSRSGTCSWHGGVRRWL